MKVGDAVLSKHNLCHLFSFSLHPHCTFFFTHLFGYLCFLSLRYIAIWKGRTGQQEMRNIRTTTVAVQACSVCFSFLYVLQPIHWVYISPNGKAPYTMYYTLSLTHTHTNLNIHTLVGLVMWSLSWSEDCGVLVMLWRSSIQFSAEWAQCLEA